MEIEMKDEKNYFYNIRTQQFSQIEDEYYKRRLSNFKSVQSAKKLLAKSLWIKEDVKFKITKKENKYIVEADKTIYTPLADKKFSIKSLDIEFKNIRINPNHEYEDIKIVTGDEYNELFKRKVTKLADIINSQNSPD